MRCFTHRLRAIDDNEKALRKQSILEAAQGLFAADPADLPSVINIAKAAGLAKGTVYLYFKTKEEIFLEILATQYQALLQEIATLIESSADESTIIRELISLFEQFTAIHPTFMPLSSMANSVIEKNVDTAIIAEFKRMLIREMQTICDNLTHQFPSLSRDQGNRLLLNTNAIIIGLWQMQNWPDKVKPMMQQPEFRTISPDFSQEIKYALQSLWTGALVLSQK